MKLELITNQNEAAVRLPNESFEIFGKLIVTKDDKNWSYREELFDTPTKQTFPEENYQLEDINKKGFAIGAFLNDECVGLAIFEYSWTKYLYLADLKVNAKYRREGVGKQLLDFAIPIAKENNCRGLSTIAQGTNLAANRFYLRYGFSIGGLNTQSYFFTSQSGNSDIFYYLNF
ncbi:GNAT family N-acetyltransferase [Arthrobacter citreus]|nr:GNAT family N-acetyltransferase [Arthrobacter citreus]